MSIRLFIYCSFLAGTLISGELGAKTLYVNSATGSDSVTYAANSQGAPWRSLGRAVWGSPNRGSPSTSEAARAGDIVIVSGGPFSAPATGERNNPVFNPVNTGTAGNPIVIRAQGRVELRTTGGTGPVMGAYMRNYITWEGNFYIDENFVPPHSDTGSVVVWDTIGTIIDGCEIQGRPITYVDNHTGVRVEYGHNSTIRNCRITGVVGTTGSDLMHHNKAGIMLYYSDGITMENNEISNSGSGIFPKGGNNYNITIRYNRISNTKKAIRATFSSPATGINRIYQNIITTGVDSDPIGIEIAEGAYHWTVANNTIYGVNNGIYVSPSADIGTLRISNNLISNVTTAINAYEIQAPLQGAGRNLYYNAAQWAWNSRIHSSLTAWLAAVPSDGGSVVANPLFINAANGDFHVAAGSPASSLGVDHLDLNRNGTTTDTIAAGAYVLGNEVIGRGFSEVRPTSPPNPRVE